MNLEIQPSITRPHVQIINSSPPQATKSGVVVTSSVIYNNTDDTFDHPEHSIDLGTLARRVTTQIPDSIIQDLVSAASSSTLEFQRASDALVVLLR